jgi:hypothetical protein
MNFLFRKYQKNQSMFNRTVVKLKTYDIRRRTVDGK